MARSPSSQWRALSRPLDAAPIHAVIGLLYLRGLRYSPPTYLPLSICQVITTPVIAGGNVGLNELAL
jgi:hypothetical protein